MNSKQKSARLIVGVVLVLLGIFFLFGEFVEQVFRIRISSYTWPFIILVPGLLVFLIAFVTERPASRFLLVIGSLISATGLLLFVQNLTGWWATWAYAWAFIFPTSVGLGQIVYGFLRGEKDLQRSGWGLTKVGLVILLLGVVFFELLLGISGFRFFGLREFCFPAVLIVLGLAFILRTLLTGRRTAAITPPSTPPATRPDWVTSLETPPAEEPAPDAGPVEWESGEAADQEENQ